MSNSSPRYRVDFKQHGTTAISYNNGAVNLSENFQEWDSYHFMSDQVNPMRRGTPRTREPGFCQHLKVDKTYRLTHFVWTAPDGSAIDQSNMAGYYSSWFTSPGGQSPTGKASVPEDLGYSNMLGDFTKTSRFSNLCLEAWNKFRTQVPTSVSLLNFIYELKDFKELGKSLSKIPKHLRDGDLEKRLIGPVINPRTRRFYSAGRIGKRTAKAVNDSYLAYQFQWAPFVGDIMKLTQLHDFVARKIDYLRKTKGKEVTIRFVKEDCYIHPQLGSPVHGFFGGGWYNPFTLTKYQCNFVATAKLFQDLEGLDDAWTELRATSAALGFGNPLKVVWNAIPYSFLLDWVGPFGSWLDKAAVQPFTGRWDVYECTTSAHEVGEIEYSVSRPSGPNSLPRTLQERVRVDKYIRLCGLPLTLGAVDFTQLTSDQQKLFLSLGLARVL